MHPDRRVGWGVCSPGCPATFLYLRASWCRCRQSRVAWVPAHAHASPLVVTVLRAPPALPAVHIARMGPSGHCAERSVPYSYVQPLPALTCISQKNPRVRKIRVRNSGAGNGCANFMDTWKKFVLSAGKTMSVKFPFFGFFFWGGGGVSANFIFMGARIFLNLIPSLKTRGFYHQSSSPRLCAHPLASLIFFSLVFWFSLVFSNQGNFLVFWVFWAVFSLFF